MILIIIFQVWLTLTFYWSWFLSPNTISLIFETFFRDKTILNESDSRKLALSLNLIFFHFFTWRPCPNKHQKSILISWKTNLFSRSKWCGKKSMSKFSSHTFRHLMFSSWTPQKEYFSWHTNSSSPRALCTHFWVKWSSLERKIQKTIYGLWWDR